MSYSHAAEKRSMLPLPYGKTKRNSKGATTSYNWIGLKLGLRFTNIKRRVIMLKKDTVPHIFVEVIRRVTALKQKVRSMQQIATATSMPNTVSVAKSESDSLNRPYLSSWSLLEDGRWNQRVKTSSVYRCAWNPCHHYVEWQYYKMLDVSSSLRV